MANRLGSKATSGGVFPGVFQVKHGTFTGELVGLQLYHSDKWNSDELELNLGFIFDIDDPDADHEPGENGLYRHTESFVRLNKDMDGNFGPGSTRAKAYKILSALYGADFDPFHDEFEWWFEFPEGVEFNSIEEIPHYKSYGKDEEWLYLDNLVISPGGDKPERGVIGEKAMLKFGHAQKPNGDYSDKITIVEAIALPRSSKNPAASKGNGAAKAKAATPASEPAAAAAPAAAPTATVTKGATTLPKYITWTHNKLRELGIERDHWKPLIEYIVGEDIASDDSFSKEQAKVIKGIYDDNPSSITEAYEVLRETWAAAPFQTEATSDEDDEEWDD